MLSLLPQVSLGVVPTTAGPQATPIAASVSSYVWVIIAIVVVGVIIAVVLVVVIIVTRRKKKSPKYVYFECVCPLY